MKKNADFRNALGQPDEYFRQSVIDTLNELNREAEQEKRPSARPVFRTVCACAAMLAIILGSVLAFRTNAWQALTASSPDSIRPTPEVFTQAEEPQVFETELATFTVREAVADDIGVYIAVDVEPKDEHVLVADMDLPIKNIGPERSGQKSDFEHQTLAQWVTAHDYKLLGVHFSLSPDGSDSSPRSYILRYREGNQETSDVAYIIDKAKPDTQEYPLYWYLVPCDTAGTAGSDLLPLQEEHGVFPVRVSAKKETVKTVESDLVTITFHDAVSDGTGVFIPAEIRAKNEKTLPLLLDTNFLGSPKILGKTPDYPDQNILQWARKHGYEDLMFITLASPNMSPTSDARLNGFSNVFSLQDDGSLAGTIAGSSIPEATLYGLYWSAIPYDMDKAEKYMRETHGLPLDSEDQEAGIVQIAAADEAETPETVAVYQLTGTADKNGQVPETTLSLFRTSRCDYLLFRSEDKQYFGYNAVTTRGDVYYGRHIPYITRTELQEGRAVSILSSWQFPDPLPDTLSIGLYMYNFDPDSGLESSDLEFRRIR